MSVARSRTPFKALAFGLALFGVAPPVTAESISASRARVEHASIALPAHTPRECWARYATGGGQTRNGMIEEVAFRVPCPEQMNADFLQTLQRALKARGFYSGPVSGKADLPTREAVQAFQRDNGFNSPILTLDTARRLGIVPIEFTHN